MKIRFLIALCCVLVSRQEVRAEEDYDVKRGTYPYMAFLYYLDEYVVDVPSQTRFLRAAVLIKPEWLISSAIDHPEINLNSVGFPRKTLLARTGAILIDSNFTLNEDEDEQEREIVQIVRPYAHKPDKWWLTDITLLKTLLPFNISIAVAFTTLNPRKDYKENNCIILVYARLYSNITLERYLMQKFVEIVKPANNDTCGSYFNYESMTCAMESGDNKGAYDPDTFCQGNGGGPLICESEVMGIQTYIKHDCKPPHLYQLLYHWDTLISCSLDEVCETEYICNNVCNITRKDLPTVTYSPTRATHSISPETTEIISEEGPSSEEAGHSAESSPEEEVPSLSTEAETTTTSRTTSIDSETSTVLTTTTADSHEATASPWPKESHADGQKQILADEASNQRGPKAEAQLQQDVTTNKPKRSAADKTVCLIHSLVLGYFVLTCVI